MVDVVSPTVHLDGLMHLGALCVAVTAAYVGFDKIKVEDDNFSNELKKIKEDVQTFIESNFDIRCSKKELLKESLRLRSVIVLCYIAYARTQTRFWKWPVHVLHRQTQAPLYRYFFGRSDLAFMTCACIFSLITFLFLVGIQVFNLDIPFWLSWTIPSSRLSEYLPDFSISLPKVFYGAYCFIILASFASVYVSTNLKPSILRDRCNKLFKSALAQKEKVYKDYTVAAYKFRPTTRDGAPPKLHVAQAPTIQTAEAKLQPSDGPADGA